MSKLHISRVRKRGEPDWFDPQTDVRKIIPTAMMETVDTLLLQCGDGSREEQDLLYLRQCIEIFRIRILEDPAHVSDQIGEFFFAIGKVCPQVRNAWFGGCMTVLMCVYALFCRRDSAVDRDELKNMLEYSRLCAMKDSLSDGTWTKVREELRNRGSLLVQNKTDSSSCAMCVETGQMFEGLKEVAARFINASGSQTWTDKAAACDEMFNAPGERGDMVNLALALAYPDYDHPTLDVEMDVADDAESDNEPKEEKSELG